MLYVTTGNRDEARRIGKVLVEEKLCACVNILDPMESLYWWNGEVQNETETVLIVKTTQKMVSEVTKRIKKLHSYEVPCVISLPLSSEEGNPEYISWIRKSVLSQN
ncbi:divalent-cation tolerance protein CutA [Rhodohalobacter sp. SW132]|nr:divalent-cation tolerance protein CutA [Rhodohalobacter sp. SW132]